MRIKTRLKIICGPLPLVPLVNVVFLLLIFFLLSNSTVFWPGTSIETRVQLPQSRTNSLRAVDKLVVTITRAELLFFNDRPVQWDDLERQLKDLVHSRRLSAKHRAGANGERDVAAQNPLLVLRADKSISYDKVIEVISLARSLDLGVYLVTDSPGGSSRARTPTLGTIVE